MYNQLTAQQIEEQKTFARFVRRINTNQEWLEVTCRPTPEPDLLCKHSTKGFIAFELVSLTDPNIARVQAAGNKARQDAFSTSDPSTRIVLKKLHKKYETSAPDIELLIYTDGQIITPDDVIIPTIAPLLDSVSHPFTHIWFMGEYEALHLWPHAN